jgi:hypothetical protein
VPILAGGVPVVETPDQIDLKKDSRGLNLRRVSDGVFPLEPTGKEFFFRSGSEGLGLGPREVIRDTQMGVDGSRLREIRYTERPIFLPLFVKSDSSHAEYLDSVDALDSLFEHEGIDVGEDGTVDLVATSLRGTRTLRCVYLEGREGSMHPTERGIWGSWGIRLLACRPHWSGGEWTTPLVRQGGVYAFPGALGDGFGTSQALGSNITVDVPGNIRSCPQVEVVGPATAVTITSASGMSVTVPAGVASGETFVLTTDPRGRAATFNGVKNWTRVGPLDTYGQGFLGNTSFNITMTGTSAATSARVYGTVWWSKPW